MKPRLNPSNLFLSRHGIYYFRCRIPLEVKKQYSITKNEVRKSLRTSNYSEELRKARKLWVEMTYKNIEEMYHDIERHDEMLKKGRELWNELQRIKNLPDFVASDEDDFIHSLKSEYEYNCLRLALDTFGNKSSAHPPSSTINYDFTEIHSKLDDLQKTVSDDGLKEITISEDTKNYYQWYIEDQKENKDNDTPVKSKGDKIRALKTFSILLGGDRLLKELNQEIIENEYVPIAKIIPKRLDTIYNNPPNQKVTEILEQHLEEIFVTDRPYRAIP